MSIDNTPGTDERAGLLKQAAVALDYAQKRDDAIKLAFDMVEQSKIPSFQCHEEFQVKVAELMSKDLRVVEEALNMDANLADFGKVASDGGQPADAASAFYHALADD